MNEFKPDKHTETVDIEGLDKRRVMRALYNHAVQAISQERQAGESEDPVDQMFASGAVELDDETIGSLDIGLSSKQISSDPDLDNVRSILGVPINMRLGSSIAFAGRYDEHYGENAAQNAIEALRNEDNDPEQQ